MNKCKDLSLDHIDSCIKRINDNYKPLFEEKHQTNNNWSLEISIKGGPRKLKLTINI